jgi:peroxiredoxin Q/BCP
LAANAAFAKKFGFPFPLLCDTTREVGLAYGACDSADAKTAKRITYLIGPDGRILRAYPSVSAGEHPRQVLDDLEDAV